MLSESPTKFTNVQLELLKLYGREVTDEELLDIKQLLSDYFMGKAIDRADKIAVDKGYTQDTFDSWRNEE